MFFNRSLAWKLVVPVMPLLLAACGGDVPQGSTQSQSAGARRVCPDDNNPCTTAGRVKGKCVQMPVADGTPCDSGGTCQAGTCSGSVTVPEVAVGECQVCARYPGGTTYCWGRSCEGSLGRGEGTGYTGPYTPAPILNVSDAIHLAGGDEHNCVARADTSVACWGWNQGSLGDGTNNSSDVPVAALGLTGVIKLAAGRTHTCAIVQGGQVYCWGDSFFGQNGFATDTNTPGAVSGVTDAIDIGASEGDTCIVHQTGVVSCWGWHAAFWAGLGGSYTYTHTPTDLPGISDAVAIGLGHDHACVVHAGNGTVSCFGNNSDGQLGTGEYGCGDGTWDCVAPGKPVVGLSGVVQVAGSYVHTCAVQTSGQAYCFGWLPTLDANGNVVRHDVLAPEAVSGLADAAQVSTSEINDDADCAVRRNGQIVCWGTNSVGQFGDPNAPDSVTPVPVAGLP